MGQSIRATVCALLLASTFLNRPAGASDPNAPSEPGRPGPGAPDASPARPAEDARQRIESILNQPLNEPLDFVEAPLRDVAVILAETYDLPIQFDTAALDAVAASPDMEVTARIANVTLRSALNLMLKNAGSEPLTYVVDDEVLLITTQEEAAMRREVVVYRVDDLIAVLPGSQDPFAADFDTLIDVIVTSVEPESWMENGTGEGDVRAFPPGMLVVSQTHRVHEQLQRLLADLRRGKAEVLAATADQREVAAARPVTRSLRVADRAFADADNREKIQHALMQSVDWQPDDDAAAAEDAFLHVLPDRVLIRHLPPVVRQVEAIIREISPSTAVYGGAGGLEARTRRDSAGDEVHGGGMF